MSTLSAVSTSVPGTLRQRIKIAGRHCLTTDEPASLGGEDSAAAPHELLPAAVASCVSTTLLMYARRKGWELGDVSVAVEYEHRATPRRCHVEVTFSGDLDAGQLERLEAVAASCPVRRALEAGVVFDERLALGAAA